jgi:RNA polymerase sigma-70 factor (ECF subfamily)
MLPVLGVFGANASGKSNLLGLDDFRYLHSTRAELLRRLGRTDQARDAYRRARELTDGGAERRFLERRLTELAGTTGSG